MQERGNENLRKAWPKRKHGSTNDIDKKNSTGSRENNGLNISTAAKTKTAMRVKPGKKPVSNKGSAIPFKKSRRGYGVNSHPINFCLIARFSSSVKGMAW